MKSIIHYNIFNPRSNILGMEEKRAMKKAVA
jgi:hypothetical protein